MGSFNSKFKIALLGLSFGLLFPIVATLIEMNQKQQSFFEVQTQNGSLIWIIDLAPFVIGLLFYFIGRKIDEYETLLQATQKNTRNIHSIESYQQSTLKTSNLKTGLISLGIFVIGSIISILAFYYLDSLNQHSIHSLISDRSKLVTKDLIKSLEDRFSALDRMADRFTHNNQSKWMRDAINISHYYKGFQAISWVDAHTQVQWIYPLEGNEQAQGFRLNQENKRKQALELVLKTKRRSLTEPLELKQGFTGFLSLHPIISEQNQVDGYIVGVYRTQELFSRILTSDFHLSISMNDREVFSQGIKDLDYGLRHDFHIDNITFNIYVSPSQSLIEQVSKSYFSYTILSLLLLVTVIIAIFVAYLLTSRSALSYLLMQSREYIRHLDEVTLYSVTDQKGTILEVNQKFLTMTGYHREEVIGKNHHILNSGFQSKEFIRGLWQTISSGQIWKGELRDKAKDGSLFWLETTIFPKVNRKGNILGYTAIAIDITQRKLQELHTHYAREQALEALEVKKSFLANMSHEIRTPLNGIIGITEILTLSPLDKDAMEKVKIIQKSGEILLRIINDILDFSKLEANKFSIILLPTNVRNVLSKTLDLLKPLALERGNEIQVKISPHFPPWIEADPTRLAQILTNLINNSIKFTHNGLVSINIQMITDGMCQVDIQDSGIGMDKAEQAKLFKSFSQIDGTIRRKYMGTGLGLSISKSLVELMGGKIWVKSAKGTGSTFSFQFPTQETSEPTGSDSKDYQDNHIPKNLKILVVEDNEVNRTVVEGFLAEIGLTCDMAFSGRAAIEKASNNNYDIILMDCHMPEMDGFEATREILKMKDPPKIIALTASSMAEDQQRCMNAGMHGFLAKPFRLREFVDTIQVTLDQSIFKRATTLPADRSNTVFDPEFFCKQYMNNPKLLHKAADGIIKESQILIESIENLFTTDDKSKDLKKAVHTLKGVIGLAYSQELVTDIERIEHQIDNQSMTEALHSFKSITLKILKLHQQLTAIKQKFKQTA